MRALATLVPLALALAGCPPTTLVGQPCATPGESVCEGDALIRCDGQFYRELATCAAECVEQSGRAGTLHDAANISADETWTCVDGPHLVGTTITVAAGVTLTLEAGAFVKLEPASRVIADPAGRIDSLGTIEAPVLLTSNNGQTGGFGAGAEGGLNVFAVEDGEPSRIEHTIIERGTHGLGVFGLSSTASPPVVENNTFRDNERFGIFITCNEDAPPIPAFEENNEFFGNGDGAVSGCPAP